MVDNGSRFVPRDLGDDVVVIETGENLGFGPGANVGFRWFLEQSAADVGDLVALAPHHAPQ